MAAMLSCLCWARYSDNMLARLVSEAGVMEASVVLGVREDNW